MLTGENTLADKGSQMQKAFHKRERNQTFLKAKTAKFLAKSDFYQVFRFWGKIIFFI